MNKKYYFLISLLIALGFFLTIISWLGLCSVECEEGHNFRLFGFPFEWSGFAFFTLSAMGLYFGQHYRLTLLLLALPLLFASAIGAELFFIWIQHAKIGTWCPVCLGIAGIVGASAVVSFLAITPLIKGHRMSKLKYISSIPLTTIIGFLVAFAGISQINPLEASQKSLKDSLAFGNKSSPIEVYLFSDWACSACRALEPRVEEIAKTVMEQGQIFFIDHAIHSETLNFLPYNLSFQLNDKEQYFALREMLTKLSKETGQPRESMIEERAKNLGVEYKELNFSEVAQAIHYYKTLADQFKITGTPVLVVINCDTNKGKRLKGTDEINLTSVQEAIDLLKSD